MNDFTQEELQEIKDSLHRDSFSAQSVAIKIQSMIDKYCDHEWVNGVYCGKCNKGILD